MKRNNDITIDFVIPWVDGNDPEWIKSFQKYNTNDEKTDTSNIRYRDHGLLRYWFRAVEEFAPWVNKVHFITNGQKPEWLNINNNKLNWVKHDDYIPNELLPVFSSHPIELYMHKIPNLSEHFVYFNDDIFITNKVSPSYFFKNGLPCDYAIMDIKTGFNMPMTGIVLNNLREINSNFNKHKVIQKNFSKWFNLSYKKRMINNISLAPWNKFPGFLNAHTSQPFLKSIIEECWNHCPNALNTAINNKFRNYNDVNQWLFKHWALCKGKFHPVNPYKGKKYLEISDTNINMIAKDITSKRYKEIVINDSFIEDFESSMEILNNAFNTILPNKSSFEL